MAYARRSKTARYPRKGKRSTRRSYSVRRRSSGKKRTYRKKRAMSTKSILNKTSKKKRNTMLSWSNTNPGGAVQALAAGPTTIAGSASGLTLGILHFRPTAMDLASFQGGPNQYVDVSQRTSTTCFMRGLAENVRIETNTGTPWFHRRICLTSRDRDFTLLNSGDTPGTERINYAGGAVKSNNGFQRLAANIQLEGTSFAATLTQWTNLLFKGEQGKDWDELITAPLDTTRVSVKYDKTWVYKSGNERGILKETKLWHPMNKNLVYADDETGATMFTTTSSVTDNRGMGDYHIFDLFGQGSSGSNADLLKIRFTSSMYWHEK